MLTIRGLGPQHFENAVERRLLGQHRYPRRAVQANAADVGGLGDQVTKALKLEGLLCTERLVVRATSAP